MPVLSHRLVTAGDAPEPQRWMLVLHGIYGAGRNWLSVARRFVESRPDWGSVLVDLRQHGRSTGFKPPHDLDACAGDLRELVLELDIEATAILGHSFGGKVALVYSREPSVPLESVWVIDSTPDAGPPRGSAWGMLEVLRAHPGPFDTRVQGMDAIEAGGFDRPVAQWMSTNLSGGEAGFRWRIAADDMESLLLSFFETDAWDAIERPTPSTQIHVVKAEESSILTPAACARVEDADRVNGQSHLHRVAGGHWVNSDNPDALNELLVEHQESS